LPNSTAYRAALILPRHRTELLSESFQYRISSL
jgi:hypothetical protein